MGADIKVEHGYVEAKAKRPARSRDHFDTVTVTGTENIMMAASLADRRDDHPQRRLRAGDRGPRRAAHQDGARIQGAGGSTIRVEGVDRLHGAEHTVIPDRIETGTFVAAVRMAGGEIEIRNCHPPDLRPVLDKFRETGVRIEEGPDNLRGARAAHGQGLRRDHDPHPASPPTCRPSTWPHDHGQGVSTITESIFENRYMHVAELQRMGANIRIDGRVAQVRGTPR
jgi:UDP-N-acetylglucosamine 1-carboxyvinyltransferase